MYPSNFFEWYINFKIKSFFNHSDLHIVQAQIKLTLVTEVYATGNQNITVQIIHERNYLAKYKRQLYKNFNFT